MIVLLNIFGVSGICLLWFYVLYSVRAYLEYITYCFTFFNIQMNGTIVI